MNILIYSYFHIFIYILIYIFRVQGLGFRV
jgi:hypothetical protein